MTRRSLLQTGSLTVPAERVGTSAVLGRVSVGSAVPSVTIAIPQTHKNLRIVWRGRSDYSGGLACGLYMRFNGDSSAKYDEERLQVNGTGTAASELLAQTQSNPGVLTAATATAGKAGTGSIELPGYSDTAFHKSFTATAQEFRNEATTNMFVRTIAGLWRSTAAITSITFFSQLNNLAPGTEFTIIGTQGSDPF